MHIFSKLIIVGIIAFTSLASLPVFASALDDARKANLVTELNSGYVQANASANAKIKALVADVNLRRKVAYGRIAKKNNLSIAAVASQSYKQRIKK